MSRSDLSLNKPGSGNISQTPGLLRHLAILFYDGLLLVALLLVATALALPFNSGEAFASDQYFYPLYLGIVSFIYYGWFWTHGGQTLGMKTWKIKIQTFDNQPVSWMQAGKRFVFAIVSWGCLGLGFLWQLWDKKHCTWHDHLSGTTLFFTE